MEQQKLKIRMLLLSLKNYVILTESVVFRADFREDLALKFANQSVR